MEAVPAPASNATCLDGDDSRLHPSSGIRWSIAHVAVPEQAEPFGQAARASRWRADANAATTSSFDHGSGAMVMK